MSRLNPPCVCSPKPSGYFAGSLDLPLSSYSSLCPQGRWPGPLSSVPFQMHHSLLNLILNTWSTAWAGMPMVCPKDHLSVPTTSWEPLSLVIGPVSKSGTKGGLSSTQMDLSPILRSPSPTETPGRQALTGPRMVAGRDLRAPGAGALPVTPATFGSPAPRGSNSVQSTQQGGRSWTSTVPVLPPLTEPQGLVSITSSRRRSDASAFLSGQRGRELSMSQSLPPRESSKQGAPSLSLSAPHQPSVRPPQPWPQVRPLREPAGRCILLRELGSILNPGSFLSLASF